MFAPRFYKQVKLIVQDDMLKSSYDRNQQIMFHTCIDYIMLPYGYFFLKLLGWFSAGIKIHAPKPEILLNIRLNN